MPVQVTGPDGLQYQFPDGTDKAAAIAYFKKKGIGAKAAAAPTGGPEARTVGNYLSEAVRGAGRGLKDDVVGLYDTVRHPIDTATGLVRQTGQAASDAAKEFRETAPAPLYQRGVAAALTGLENAPMVGGMVQHAEQGGGRMASPEGVGAAAEGITTFAAPDLVAHAIPKIVDFAKERAANTGSAPRAVGELVKKTREGNEVAAAKAEETNAAQAQKRAADVQKHFEKAEAVKKANETAVAEVSRRQAIERGLEQKDVEFQEELKETAKRVKEQADQKYSAVRAATEGKTVPSSELAGAVKAAEDKLQGSNENIKVFRDILAKHPETDPNFVEYQGAQIPKGHPLYDVLTAETPQAAGATFADLQGYYSELGDKLASGTLNGDVYQAMKSLHDSIGGLMQKVADQSGVGPQLRDAQQFYRGYMQTFRDSSSPLYKAIKASERGKSIKALAGKDQTGIQALARYNPELAQKANTLRGYQQEAEALPKKAPVSKALPKLAEKPDRVVPEQKVIGAKDIEAVKQHRAQMAANHVRHWGTYLGFVWPAIEVIRGATRGELPDIGSTAASMIATPLAADAIARIIESPKMQRILTRATPKDIAQIPADLRGDLPAIVETAQKRGIIVSPALLAATTGAALAGQRKPVAAALSANQ